MVWERIEELRRQEEQRAAQEAANERRRQADSAARAQAEATRAQAEATRAREAKRKAHKELLDKSGVLSEMRGIAKGLEGRVRRYAIVEDLDSGTATLAWGNKFAVEDGKIVYERGFLSRGQMDYSLISVTVNLSKQSISIKGQGYSPKTISQAEWTGNRLLVRDSVAQAYLHPDRVNERETPPSKYSSSSSGPSSECCNN